MHTSRELGGTAARARGRRGLPAARQGVGKHTASFMAHELGMIRTTVRFTTDASTFGAIERTPEGRAGEWHSFGIQYNRHSGVQLSTLGAIFGAGGRAPDLRRGDPRGVPWLETRSGPAGIRASYRSCGNASPQERYVGWPRPTGARRGRRR